MYTVGTMQKLSENKCFSGSQLRFEHVSEVLHCNMTFSIFLPPQAELSPVPALYWLSGLTCTDENFVTKAGAQQYAAELGIAIVCPDTSPRGDAVPDDVAGAYDFGLGAGLMTQDLARGHRVASALESGNVWVNTYNLLPPGLPFGGSKNSGFGRENSAYALDAYSEIKTTYIQL